MHLPFTRRATALKQLCHRRVMTVGPGHALQVASMVELCCPSGEPGWRAREKCVKLHVGVWLMGAIAIE